MSVSGTVLAPPTLMVVHAHPDDECLGTGGTLARYSAEGINTVLVTATRGEEGHAPDDEQGPEGGRTDRRPGGRQVGYGDRGRAVEDRYERHRQHGARHPAQGAEQHARHH